MPVSELLSGAGGEEVSSRRSSLWEELNECEVEDDELVEAAFSLLRESRCGYEIEEPKVSWKLCFISETLAVRYQGRSHFEVDVKLQTRLDEVVVAR